MSPLLGRMAAEVGRLKGSPPHLGDGWSRSPISISLVPSVQFLDGVDAVVRDQQGVVVGAVEPWVRVLLNPPLAEGALEVAVLVKDDDGVLAARQHVHRVLRVHRDAGALDEGHAVGQLLPPPPPYS